MTIQQLQQYPLGAKGLRGKCGNDINYVNGYSHSDTIECCKINKGMEWAQLVGVEENIFMPILYPLSALTQEIQVYGERFIPAIEIAKRVDNGHSSASIIKEYTGMIVVKTGKIDDVENVSIRYANGKIIGIYRSETPILFYTCLTIEALLQSWFINYRGIESVSPFDLPENPYKRTSATTTATD